MIIKPRIRGFICVTAHPEGCKSNVAKQIEYVTAQGAIASGPKKVLVIGASTGYGLAARISAAFGCGADTLGVFFERPGEETKPATAGWYNSAAFEEFATEKGLYAKSINGDAYSDAVKQKTIELIKEDLGQVDLVVYSLAAPRRIHPKTGRKCLFVCNGYTNALIGLTKEESEEILEFLFDHITGSDFKYEHQWRVGDVLIWDNCAVQHKAKFDYALPLRRLMQRCTIEGDKPY